MIVAAVPVRSIHDGKRRLRVDDRAAMAAHMLAHVLDTLAAVPCISHVAVISPDPAALDLAARHGALGRLQRSAGLNAACQEAAAWARQRGARALLLAHADLPRLTAESVTEVVLRCGLEF